MWFRTLAESVVGIEIGHGVTLNNNNNNNNNFYIKRRNSLKPHVA